MATNTVGSEGWIKVEDGCFRGFHTDAEVRNVLGEKSSLKKGFYVHGAPARDLDQVVDFLSGDSHDVSKVQYYNGEQFLPIAFGD